MKQSLIAIALLAFLPFGCKKNAEEQSMPPSTAVTEPGDAPPARTPDDSIAIPAATSTALVALTSDADFKTTLDRLRQAIEAKPPLSLMEVIDHSENAKSAKLELPPTSVVLFGNPKVGTPLMTAAPTLAIDLPQKILVYEREGKVHVAYLPPSVLAARHELTGKDDSVAAIETALAGLSATAAGASGPRKDAATFAAARSEKFELRTSNADFATTTDRLRAAIDESGLTVMKVIEHHDNAKKAGLSLPPTSVFIFGNPKVGTALMAAAPTLAIDLPQKILVYEHAGSVHVVHASPEGVAARHRLTGKDDALSKIATALDSLAAAAAGKVAPTSGSPTD